MAERIELAILAQDRGFGSVSEFLEAECQDNIVPACCSEGCTVEPDGDCPHGNPSAVRAALA